MHASQSAVAGREIERLLRYGVRHGLLEEEDTIAARNALLDLFGCTEPGALPEGEDIPDSAVPILERLLDVAAETGLLPENTVTRRDLLDARIMGLLMPRQSEVARKFWETARRESIRRATDDFYALSQASNYIRMDRIRQNVYWLAATEYGELEITVNLSKPEKDPRDIAAERNAPKRDYPKCLLCLENVGYAGRIDHPARQNHRVVPVTLGGEPWYLQYSPYVYYNEHCIVFSREHRPMAIHDGTFAKLFEFVEQFPHYFLGSNADLPIVGGSILSHDHYQGGRHVFPMQKAPIERRFAHPDFPGLAAGVVKWPMSVVRLASKDKNVCLQAASRVLDEWRRYSDEQADIAAWSPEGGGRVPHNTVTPIARMNDQGLYELDLVLRNNRTSDRHPEGIFHPHRDLHHIKKENIGLIEVMGLAVLPGRLKSELEGIRRILTGESRSDRQNAAGDESGGPQQDELQKHAPWIAELVSRYGTSLTPGEAEEALRAEVGRKFLRVLEDAGVFKRDAAGQAAFRRFLRTAGFTEIASP